MSIATAVLVVALAGCSSDDTRRSGLLQAHRYDLPQGNYVTQAMLKRVEIGMSRLEVQRTLGSPLLTDVFLPQRWNYVFSFRHPNGRVDLRRVVILFGADEKVSKIDADELPATEDPSDPALPRFNPEALKRSG
ncbi:MAG: outer membrane protein assembly factor BamE [Burkholderiaceae bacterium]